MFFVLIKQLQAILFDIGSVLGLDICPNIDELFGKAAKSGR